MIDSFKTDWSAWSFLKIAGYYIGTAFIASMEYVNLSDNLLVALSAALFLDTLLGVIKNIRLGGKPSSRFGIKGIIGKVLGLFIIASVGAILKLGLGIEALGFVSTAFSLMLIYELYSIIAHAYSIFTRKKIKEYDAMSMVFKFALRYLRKLAEKLIKISDKEFKEEDEDEDEY